MATTNEIKAHDLVTNIVYETARGMGLSVYKEKAGKGWRADVLVEKADTKIAFEVQLSTQSYKKTWDRQKKFLREGVTGCWLVLNRYKKIKDEYKDLPLFNLNKKGRIFTVSLIDGRKEVPLSEFVTAFVSGDIKFSLQARTAALQQVQFKFFEMECWKCNAVNHIYYLESPFATSCNIKLEEEECLWSDEKLVFKPEILKGLNEILCSPEGKNLRMGKIKKRFSKTTQLDYLSFGCYECDSIFGDWFVMNEELDARNGFLPITSISTRISTSNQIIRDYKHWCYPKNSKFCE